MALSQQEADNLASIQSEIIQVSSTIQRLNTLTNNVATGRSAIQNQLRVIQLSINAINQDVSRQLTTQIIR